ncbi:integrin alpha-7 isoform X1 [Hydra vulgaris]|nr:integrin alpha-7 [Hydra vulgaris]
MYNINLLLQKMLKSLLLIWTCQGIYSFNLDYEYTVFKQGPADSLFGFSVTEYNSGSKAWIIVGAPLANSSYLKGSDHLNSGGIYKCDPASPSSDCSQVSDQIMFDDKDNNGQETKAGQWLGVSLDTYGIGQPIIGCAHRYINHLNGNYRLLEGKCWTIGSDFSPIGEVDPCRKRNEEEKSSNLNHQVYGWCQAGIGLKAIDETEIGHRYLVGAIGSKDFVGTVFLDVDGDLSETYVNVSASWVDSYFGYSVAYGNFFSSNVKGFASGGPRHQSFGKVLLYNDVKSNMPTQELPEIFDEFQIASGFGIALCAIDSDNNMFSELIVGAPFYAESTSIYNHGKVYVYEKSFKMNKLVLIKELYGNRDGVSDVNAHFGYALANAGDLNKDGFPDLVVGAPYENNGQGAVYVFQGAKSGLITKYSQYIVASSVMSGLTKRSLNVPLKAFGRSLATGFDMDNNGYNDVLVGAYASNQVVLLRSRPVIEVHIKVTFTPENINISDRHCSVDGKLTPCFNMTFCYNFTERNANIYKNTDTIPIKYTIIADAIQRPRINFFKNGKNKISETRLTSKDLKCIALNLYFVSNKDGVIQIYPDITFEVMYSIPYGENEFPKPDASNKDVVSLDKYPRLDENFLDGKNVNVNIKKLKLAFQRECSDCIPDLSLSAQKLQTYRLGRKTLVINVTVENKGQDPAFDVEIRFRFPKDISLDSMIITNVIKYCQNNICEVTNKLGKQAKLVVGVVLNMNSFGPSSENNVQMSINSANLEKNATLGDNSINIQIDVKVEADVEIMGGISTQQVTYGGKILGESAMKSVNDIGDSVEHKYVIHNNGPDTVPNVNVTIFWPTELKSGKHLLYLTDVKPSTTTVQCITPSLNLLHLLGAKSVLVEDQGKSDAGASFKPRKIRDLSDAITSNVNVTVEKDTRKKDGTILNCTTAKCLPIRCTIEKFAASQTVAITIYSKLWKSSLLIDYYGEVLTVVSSAEVSVGANTSYLADPNNNNNAIEIFTNIQPVFAPVSKEKIATWMIALAAIAGIILLALLVFGFWKLGFFKRKRTDSKYASKSDDKADKSLLSNKR